MSKINDKILNITVTWSSHCLSSKNGHEIRLVTTMSEIRVNYN